MISVEEALIRATERWSTETTNTEAETAYLDRSVLATEVIKLRQELLATEQAMTEAEREVDALQTAILNIDYE